MGLLSSGGSSTGDFRLCLRAGSASGGLLPCVVFCLFLGWFYRRRALEKEAADHCDIPDTARVFRLEGVFHKMELNLLSN